MCVPVHNANSSVYYDFSAEIRYGRVTSILIKTHKSIRRVTALLKIYLNAVTFIESVQRITWKCTQPANRCRFNENTLESEYTFTKCKCEFDLSILFWVPFVILYT